VSDSDSGRPRGHEAKALAHPAMVVAGLTFAALAHAHGALPGRAAADAGGPPHLTTAPAALVGDAAVLNTANTVSGAVTIASVSPSIVDLRGDRPLL